MSVKKKKDQGYETRTIITCMYNHQLLYALSDWFKNLAPVYQPMRRKTKTNRDFHARLEQVTRKGTNLGWFIALFALAVIGRSNYFGICSTTLN